MCAPSSFPDSAMASAAYHSHRIPHGHIGVLHHPPLRSGSLLTIAITIVVLRNILYPFCCFKCLASGRLLFRGNSPSTPPARSQAFSPPSHRGWNLGGYLVAFTAWQVFGIEDRKSSTYKIRGIAAMRPHPCPAETGTDIFSLVFGFGFPYCWSFWSFFFPVPSTA